MENKSENDELDDLLQEAQEADPMHQKGAPTPVPTKSQIDEEPLKPYTPSTAPQAAQPVQPPSSELDGLLSKFLGDAMRIAKRAQDRFEEDRQEVQEVIDHFKNKVYNGQKPSTTELECLVAALRIKTDATSNLSKLGDMIARIVSSSKGQIDTDKGSAFDLDELEHIKRSLEVPDFKDTPEG